MQHVLFSNGAKGQMIQWKIHRMYLHGWVHDVPASHHKTEDMQGMKTCKLRCFTCNHVIIDDRCRLLDAVARLANAADTARADDSER